LGALVSGALITVPIQGSQTIANTAGNLWANAADMYRRMPARMVNGAAWFINQELWSKILTATSGTGGGSHPMFTPAGRLESAPNGSIHGRPIVPVEYASAEGTVGDFVFANFADYLLISKGGIRQQTSMHVEFLRDRQVLKFTWRVNGAPRTRVPLTPLKGTNTTSPYIALAARS
jgi:HK97 family phage major capsid protein